MDQAADSDHCQPPAPSCVEVAALDDAVACRDSKDPNGPALVFGRAAWTNFLAETKAGFPQR
ncbi:DUF397 domain-containing protein [Salinispora pacifica]|uniref:DUF397 domain-containing protein n=1 Tax=Salinispora pacifica TaxID=351187 RepID=UPI0022B6C31F|nr:DUF397 domain-containing protein [Salinispora pacifica]